MTTELESKLNTKGFKMETALELLGTGAFFLFFGIWMMYGLAPALIAVGILSFITGIIMALFLYLDPSLINNKNIS